MSIKKDYDGYFTGVCDECGVEEETGCDDFMDAVHELKAAMNWRSELYKDKWYNYCPNC